MKKHEALNYLREVQGQYTGGGINHEGEHFQSLFKLDSMEGAPGVTFTYKAKVGNKIVHDESSLVASDELGRLVVFAMTSNTPAVFQHLYQESLSKKDIDSATLVFQYGDIENTNSFRERLELKINFLVQEVEYAYFWGMPGKDFGERSRSKMKRIAH